MIIPPGFQPLTAQNPEPAPEPAVESVPSQEPAQAPDLAPTPPATQEPPAADPEIAEDVIMRALQKASGGAIADQTQLNQYLERAKQAEEYAAKLAQLEGHNPYADEIVKKVNELRSEGASLEDVQRFISIQAIDPAKMDRLEAVRMAAKIENPDYDDAMIDAVLAENMGLQAFVEGEEPGARDKVRLDQAFKKAIQTIEAQKVQVSAPASVEDKLRAKAEAERVAQSYAAEAARVTDSLKKIKLQAADGLDFEFDVPGDALPIIQQALVQAGVSGQYKLGDTESAKQLGETFAWAVLGPKMLRAAMLHGQAKGREEALKSTAGAPPARAAHQMTPQQQQPAREWIDPKNLILR